MPHGTSVTLENVSFTYESAKPPVEALSNVSFSVPAGTAIAVIGPSGCGKTTLLHILAGLKAPSSGRVSLASSSGRVFFGKEGICGHRGTCRRKGICGCRGGIALIPQNYGLLPWKTTWENVALGLVIRGVDRRELEKRVKHALTLFGIDGECSRYPAELSGGQRQRVAIARALAIEPDLILMDEPFSALDALTRERLQDSFLTLWEKFRFTTILVTHSIEEAAYLGHKIIVLSNRPGHIIAEVPNPFFGLPGVRMDEGFHRLTSELRGLLRDVPGTNPAGLPPGRELLP